MPWTGPVLGMFAVIIAVGILIFLPVLQEKLRNRGRREMLKMIARDDHPPFDKPKKVPESALRQDIEEEELGDALPRKFHFGEGENNQLSPDPAAEKEDDPSEDSLRQDIEEEELGDALPRKFHFGEYESAELDPQAEVPDKDN